MFELKSTSKREMLYLAVLVLIVNLTSQPVVCKPTIDRALPQHNLKTIIRSAQDLIALPTSNSQREPAEHAPQTQIQYVSVDQSGAQQEQQQPQEVVYYMLPDGTTIEASEYIKQQQQQQSQPEPGQNQFEGDAKTAVESASAEQLANGYPGEIVYTNQAGELLRQVDGSYEPLGNTNNKQQVYSRPSVELVTMAGKSLRESSADLRATILTEIPLNDMSQEGKSSSHLICTNLILEIHLSDAETNHYMLIIVLEQLKKDYGAKVVATREYPGANLVINCAEHSGLDVSLCSGSKQPPKIAYQIEPEQERHISVQKPMKSNQVSTEYNIGPHTTSGPEYVTASPLEVTSDSDSDTESNGERGEHDFPVIEHEHESEHESEKLINHNYRQPETETHEDYKQQHHQIPIIASTEPATPTNDHESQNDNNEYQNHEAHHQQYEIQQPQELKQHQQQFHQEANSHQSSHETNTRNAHNNGYQQTTETYANQQQIEHETEDNDHPESPSTTTTTTTTTTTSTSSAGTELDQIAPTSAYNVADVTSAATNSKERKIPLKSRSN